MGFIEWEDRFDLGVVEMNDEHKVLIKKMNHVHDLVEQKVNGDLFKKAFKDFADYTIQHFKDEEMYMEKIGFPGIETHKGIHKTLLSQVSAFSEDVGQGKELGPKFFDFLKLWLSAHICGIDMKYAKYKS